MIYNFTLNNICLNVKITKQLNKIVKIFVLVKNSLYVCIMKRQIQSYISEEDYSKLKLIAEKEGLLFATLIRQILINYLKTKKND